MDAQTEFENGVFRMHWLIVTVMVLTVFASLLICEYQGAKIQFRFDESMREFLRSVFYLMAIITFPVTSLFRHVLLRLNQTMPGDKPARIRYLVTIIMTQVMIESVAVLGVLMFVLGDGYNTLYIFNVMALLGFFLHRPKKEEYVKIVAELERRKG